MSAPVTQRAPRSLNSPGQPYNPTTVDEIGPCSMLPIEPRPFVIPGWGPWGTFKRGKRFGRPNGDSVAQLHVCIFVLCEGASGTVVMAGSVTNNQKQLVTGTPTVFCYGTVRGPVPSLPLPLPLPFCLSPCVRARGGPNADRPGGVRRAKRRRATWNAHSAGHEPRLCAVETEAQTTNSVARPPVTRTASGREDGEHPVVLADVSRARAAQHRVRAGDVEPDQEQEDAVRRDPLPSKPGVCQQQHPGEHAHWAGDQQPLPTLKPQIWHNIGLQAPIGMR